MIDTTTERRPERMAVEPVVPGRAERLRYIVRYHRPSQLAMRLVAMGRKRWRRWAGAGRWARPAAAPALRENPPLVELLDGKLARRRERGSAETARRIAEGQYRFLHHEITLSDPIDWRLKEHPKTPLLWRFHLHYHEFLLDLAAEAREDPKCLERARGLMFAWIDANCPGGAALEDAWHPYCISRRLPVWVLLSSGFDGALAEAPILASMAAQTRFLERNLEWDLRGNHLMENLRALAMAGARFAGAEGDRWLEKSERLIGGQLAEQILPHGEHFERSPMYHAMMLEALLDVRDATRAVRPGLAEWCRDAADRMAGFLGAVLHPDGEIPLLGDSCLGEVTRPDILRARAEQEHRGADGKGKEGNGPVGTGYPRGRSRPSGSASRDPGPQARLVGGYWTFRDGQDFVLLDAGPVGPDELPAHAHSDLLTWEASLGGKRLVVDSGVFHYRDDAMRRYCRSTPAHNVLQIDDRPLCDTWSSFRMGYRGRPGTPQTGRSGPYHWVRAWHNACRRCGVPRVGRLMACRPGGPWICADWAEGSGTHRLTNWLHLHPDARVESLDAAGAWVAFHGRTIELQPLGPGELSLLEGWYCPAFGVREPNPVLRWTARCALPAVCGWSLAWQAPFGQAAVRAEGAEVAIHTFAEDGGRRTEGGGRRSEVGGRRSEVGGRRTILDFRFQILDS